MEQHVLVPDKFDEEELDQARKAEIDWLMSFPALELVSRETAGERVNSGEARWVGSRFEDQRKDSGELRSRWVLQDFARTKDTESAHCSAPLK